MCAKYMLYLAHDIDDLIPFLKLPEKLVDVFV